MTGNVEGPKFTFIREIVPNMKNINCHFIVLDVGAPKKTKDGHDLRKVRVADKSGSILLTVWDEVGACMQPSDICRLINGFVSVHKNCLSINCGRQGEIQKVGEFCMVFSEVPFMSAPNPELAKFCDQSTKFGSGGGGGSGGEGGNRDSYNGSTTPSNASGNPSNSNESAHLSSTPNCNNRAVKSENSNYMSSNSHSNQQASVVKSDFDSRVCRKIKTEDCGAFREDRRKVSEKSHEKRRRFDERSDHTRHRHGVKQQKPIKESEQYKNKRENLPRSTENFSIDTKIALPAFSSKSDVDDRHLYITIGQPISSKQDMDYRFLRNTKQTKSFTPVPTGSWSRPLSLNT